MSYSSETPAARHPLGLHKSLLILAVLLACRALAPATLLAAPTPGAGQILNEIPAPKSPMPPAPKLNIKRPEAQALPATTPFRVERIRIAGNTLFSSAQLHALVASGEAKELTLAQASALAERITQFYRQHGYPLDRAYIPVQTLKDATLTIAVIEARYGKVVLGALNDPSGIYKDLSGPNSKVAVEMALEDHRKEYGDKAVAKKIEVTSADHQHKPEVANSKAQELYDRQGADAILDVPTSSAALAVANVAKSKKKIFMDVGAGTTVLEGAQCRLSGSSGELRDDPRVRSAYLGGMETGRR